MPKVARECKRCGAPFAVYPSALKAGDGHFCSRACSGAARGERSRATNAERLLAIARERVTGPHMLNGEQVCHVSLARGGVAIVDAADAVLVSANRWQLSPSGYAKRGPAPASMARLICDAPQGWDIDHINGDRLDNRRCNLRVVTRAENARNRKGARVDSATGLRGVFKRSDNGPRPFEARVCANYRQIFVGAFATAEEAAAAAAAARERYHGQPDTFLRGETTPPLSGQGARTRQRERGRPDRAPR